MLSRAMFAIVVIGVIMLGLAPLIMISEHSAVAQTTSSTTTTSAATTTQLTPASSSNKIFYLFSAEHEGVNETKLGIPPDTYSPDLLEVTEGDNVTIHFYNLDTTDRHTFTMGSPYNINEDLLPGTNATFTFKAGDEGVFRFYCTYHQPIMSGQLIVLPPPSVEKNPVNVNVTSK
jgi:plastocyanin